LGFSCSFSLQTEEAKSQGKEDSRQVGENSCVNLLFVFFFRPVMKRPGGLYNCKTLLIVVNNKNIKNEDVFTLFLFWKLLSGEKKTKVLVFFSIRFFFQKNCKSPISADLNRFQVSFMAVNDFGVCLEAEKSQSTFKNHPMFMIFRIFENFSDFFFKNKTKKIIGIYRSELILMVNRLKLLFLCQKQDFRY